MSHVKFFVLFLSKWNSMNHPFTFHLIEKHFYQILDRSKTNPILRESVKYRAHIDQNLELLGVPAALFIAF